MEKYLVTFSVSFKAPDGRYYNSAWGRLCKSSTTGPKGREILIVGKVDKELTIPHEYMIAHVRCDEKPSNERYSVVIDEMTQENVNPRIYIAE